MNMKKLLIAVLILIFAFGCNFLIAMGAVALAAKCFGFAFAWKYVWFSWFILSFVAAYFRPFNKE